MKCRSRKSRCATARSEFVAQLADIAPKIADDGGQRYELHGGGESGARILPTQQGRHDPHVCRRGDRQQFGDPLDDSEHGDVGIARCRCPHRADHAIRRRPRPSTDAAEHWKRRQHPDGDLLQPTGHHQMPTPTITAPAPTLSTPTARRMRFKAPAACHAGSDALRLHFQIPVGDILRPPRTKCLATVTGGF